MNTFCRVYRLNDSDLGTTYNYYRVCQVYTPSIYTPNTYTANIAGYKT